MSPSGSPVDPGPSGEARRVGTPHMRRRLMERPGQSPEFDVIRLAVVAESRIFCEGLRRICAADPSLAVIDESDGEGARGMVKRTSPAILLVEFRAEDTLALCRDLRRESPRPWVILLNGEADDESAARALEAGARGILPKTATAEDLLKAIRVIHDGQIWAAKRVVARLVEQLAGLAGITRAADEFLARELSVREQEIVCQAVSGLSNREIADRLNISEATVKAHLTRIFRKLRVRDRAQLSAEYHRRPPLGASA